MKKPSRRLTSVGAAVLLALGGSAVALAATAPELPEQASDRAREALETAFADDEPEPELVETEVEESEEAGVEAANEDAGDNAEAFSAWVESLPDDWGCIRGQLVSSVARGDHRGDDFEGPTFASAEEAAEALGIADRRCAEVAINGEGDEGDAEESEGLEEDGEAGPPDHAGRPDHAGPPDHAGGDDEDEDEQETSDDG